MCFLKITLISPPSHTALCSAGAFYINKYSESKQVTDGMAFKNQATLFLYGTANRPEILLRNTSEPEEIRTEPIYFLKRWCPLTRTWTEGVISLEADCLSVLWTRYSHLGQELSSRKQTPGKGLRRRWSFLGRVKRALAQLQPFSLQRAALGVPEGAFAALTSHTLVFQMNLNLFLSKSLQKKKGKKSNHSEFSYYYANRLIRQCSCEN